MQFGAMCGMSEDEFWDCTPRFMSAKIKALEASQQLSWEQSRYLAFYSIKTDHKDKIKAPIDLGRFPWETAVAKFPPITREEWDRANDEMDEVLKHVNPGLYAQYMEGKLARQNGN